MNLHAMRTGLVRDYLDDFRREQEALKAWPDTTVTTTEGGVRHTDRPFEHHRSRVDLTLVYMRGWTDRLAQALDTRDLAQTVELGRRLERLRKIWLYFRDKFDQRERLSNRLMLDLADRLAWQVCRHHHEAALAAGRLPGVEPAVPLVCFSPKPSPWAQPRHGVFLPETLSDFEIVEREVATWTSRLPLPIIGLPWFQVAHLPQAPVIAHEVGHLIDSQYGLSAGLEQAIDEAVDPLRRGLWRKWAREAFADFFGTLTMGPAYVLALTGFLLDADAGADQPDPVKPGKHPPPDARVALCCAALKRAGLDAIGPFTADAILEAWRAGIGPVAMPVALREEAAKVASVFFDARPEAFGGVSPLGGMGGMSADEVREAHKTALDWIDGADQRLLNTTATPLLMSAATLAFARAPARYAEIDGRRPFAALVSSATPRGVYAPPDSDAARRDRQINAAMAHADVLFNDLNI